MRPAAFFTILVLSTSLCMAADPSAKLRKAAKKGDLSEFEQLLDKGANPGATDPKGRNAYSVATPEALKTLRSLVEHRTQQAIIKGMVIEESEVTHRSQLFLEGLTLRGGIRTYKSEATPKEGHVFLILEVSVPNPYPVPDRSSPFGRPSAAPGVTLKGIAFVGSDGESYPCNCEFGTSQGPAWGSCIGSTQSPKPIIKKSLLCVVKDDAVSAGALSVFGTTLTYSHAEPE